MVSKQINRQHSNINQNQRDVPANMRFMKLQKCALWYFYAFSPYIWQHLVTSPHIVLMRQTFMWLMNTVSLLYFYLNHIGLWHTHFTRSFINAYFISYVSGKQFKWILSDLNIGGELSKRVLRLNSDVFNQDCLIKRLAQVSVSTQGIASLGQWGRKMSDAPSLLPSTLQLIGIILPARVWGFAVAFWDHGDHISEGLFLYWKAK